ncbi:MAG: TonB-dependent receptor plug domain-containing protein, partial [Bacteroidota bacterium]
PNAPKKGKEKDIAIHVDAPELKVVPKGRQKTNSFQRTLTYVQEHMGVVDDGQFYTLVNDSTIIELDEVVVNENKKTRAEIVEEEINALTLHGKARNRMFIDSFPGNEQASVMDILRMFPSVSVEGRFPNQIVKVRGGLNSINLSTEPLYLLDGVQVPIDVIQGMNAFGVLFIDVLTGAEASFYGVRGANGVIAVYTDRGLRFSFEQKRYPGITNFTLQGFYKTREFHSPNYGLAKPKHKMPDYRTTLFWNPNIFMDAKSPTPISFYTGDRTGSFWVKIEGITKDGRPFKTDYRFEVE